MNIKDIKAFISVYLNKSITNTAESLFISPQGLSNVIKRIEEELGVQLFHRTNNGVVPTEYGEIFYEKTCEIIAQYDSTVQELAKLKIENEGFLRFASAFGILRYLKPEFIMDFHEYEEECQLDYVEFPDKLVEESVLSGQSTIGITPRPEHEEDFDIIPLFSKEIYFVTHDKSKFYQRSEVSAKEIVQEPLIIENENFSINHIVKTVAETEKDKLNIVFQPSGFSLCYKLCKQNKGNTVSLDFIDDDMRYDKMKIIPFKENLIWEVCLIQRKGNYQSKAAKSFIAYTKRWCNCTNKKSMNCTLQ